MIDTDKMYIHLGSVYYFDDGAPGSRLYFVYEVKEKLLSINHATLEQIQEVVDLVETFTVVPDD